MANPAVKFGLRPLRHQSGAPFNGQVNEYELLASYNVAVYIGDPVTLTTGSNATDGCPTINANGATGTPCGVVLSFKPVLTNLSLQYHLASTLQRANVADSPDIVWAIESDGTLAAADVGKFTDFTLGTASTVTGLSGYQLHEANINSSAASTLPLMVTGLYKDQNNAFGANGVAEVVLINHQYRTGSGS